MINMNKLIRPFRGYTTSGFAIEKSSVDALVNSGKAYKVGGVIDSRQQTEIFQTPDELIDKFELPLNQIKFDHLTYLDIRKQVALMAPYMQEFDAPPKEHIRITTQSHTFSAPDQNYYHTSNKHVFLTTNIDSLNLSTESKETLITLLQEKYDPYTRNISIQSDKFPLREQNLDYVKDLLVDFLEKAKDPEVIQLAKDTRLEQKQLRIMKYLNII